jgi:DNA repair exonuclease SbcCD ATPase subunit
MKMRQLNKKLTEEMQFQKVEYENQLEQQQFQIQKFQEQLSEQKKQYERQIEKLENQIQKLENQIFEIAKQPTTSVHNMTTTNNNQKTLNMINQLAPYDLTTERVQEILNDYNHILEKVFGNGPNGIADFIVEKILFDSETQKPKLVATDRSRC